MNSGMMIGRFFPRLWPKVLRLIRTHAIMEHEKLLSCIDACLDCATACENCSSQCLQEQDVSKLVDCIQLNRECAEVCYAAARLMNIGGINAGALCHVCAEICAACASECEKHPMGHCQECAQSCRNCAEECRNMSIVNG